MKSSLALALVGSLTACDGGDRDLDPGVGDDPGTGTGTLAIDGHAIARPREANASTRGAFDTRFTVHVHRGSGQDVTDALVTVTSRSGLVTLVWDGGGRYIGTTYGYDEVYVLDIVAGDDALTGVRGDGPDIHVFEHPDTGETVERSDELEVKWSREAAATQASVWGHGLDTVEIDDSGSYTVPADTLEVGDRTSVHVQRTNVVVPAGMRRDGEWRVGVENEIELVVR